MTATQAGEALGESPANTSFHLRTLAKYGFVEEAPGGTGRQRPWRRVALTHSWGHDNENPATDAAAEGLARFFDHRIAERRDIWQATRGSYPKEWRDASIVFSSVTYLTAGRAGRGRRRDPRHHRSLRRAGHRPVEAAGGRPAGGPRRHRPPDRADPGWELGSAAVGDPVQDVLAAVAARVPVDERERVSIERFLAEVPTLERPFDRARRPRARHRLGADRRPARHRAARAQVARHLGPAGRPHRRRRDAVGGRPPRGDRGDRAADPPARRSAAAGPRRRAPRATRPHPPRPALPARGRRRRPGPAARGEPGRRLVRLARGRWPSPSRAGRACSYPGRDGRGKDGGWT